MRVTGAAAVASLLRGAWRTDADPPALEPEGLEALLPGLRQGGVAGLAWNRVRRNPGLAGSAAGAALQHDFRHQALQRAVHAQAVRDAQGRLDGASEDAFLAKGWAAARLYPTPGFRPCGDIDLYVAVERHARAFAVLATGGRPLPVDLHRGLSDLADRPAREVWARTRIVEEDGLRVRVPGPEDHLRLLSLHMLRHGVSRPLWLCDVAVALETRPADFDWDWFGAGAPRRTEAALLGLRLAGELLHANLEGVPVGRAPRWLVPAVLRSWEAGVYRREPFLNQVRMSPGKALREHWPGPIEATVGMGARFDGLPRLPYQLGYAAARGLRRARGAVTRRRPALPSRQARIEASR